MSAVALPVKPAGARPPIFPPIHTAFDPGSDGAPEPYHKLVAESVRQVMKAIRTSDLTGLALLRQLIDQRKRLIESELRLERMMQAEPVLPPLLKGLYSLDFLGNEEEPVRLYTRLLNELDDAAAKIDRILADQNREASTSLN
ncbi:MAG TPA: hypothetical protein VK934_08905 [Fimbriimonas sp.]|nr:hypothetical protein [Fimbriimonas sp.]